MDDSWRFRPISDHQICPVCSVPHYPICPPPLSFSYDGLRHFSTELRPLLFHRPVYDPPPPPPPPPPPVPLARGSAPFQPATHLQPFIHEEVMERENLRKRMRLEDPGMGMHPPFQQFNRYFSEDDERRLNLVRDHGMQSNILLVQDKTRQIHGNIWMDRHPYDGKENQYSGVGIDNGFPDSAFGYRIGHFEAKTHQGFENQQSPSLQKDDRLRPQQSREYQMPEFNSDGRFVSEPFLPCANGVSSLKDWWKPASYSTNDKNSLRMANCDDQLEAQSIQIPSTLFQKHHPYSRLDDYHMAPYHKEHVFQSHGEIKLDFDKQHGESRRAPLESRPIQTEALKPPDARSYPVIEQYGSRFSKQASYSPVSADGALMPSQGHTSLAYPPFPPRPLFPIQAEPSSPNLQINSSVSTPCSVPSPVAANPSVKRQLSAYGSHSLPHGEFFNGARVQTSSGYAVEGLHLVHHPTSNLDDRRSSLPAHHSYNDESAYVDARHLFKQPYRASRPDRIVIIVRGLPGSGKSFLARAIRDVEVENGGSVPRIHAMDDYFMIEVEKAEENDGCKSSGSARIKKQALKKVIEYCYEPEMEEVYRSSMLKAFKKTLDEGTFTFVIVDDRNLRVADFAQFWAIAKRSGYEVYLLEAAYKDPAGCAARNIHGFKLDDIQKMAEQWEVAPPLYLQLDIQTLFGGDQLNEQSIQEVDMEAEDAVGNGELHHLQDTENYKSEESKSLDHDIDHGSSKLGTRWNTEEVSLERHEVLKSKWSKDLDADVHDSKNTNPTALSGLIQAYGNDVKSVSWGDRVDTSGFSIGAVKKQCSSSLIIGPGAGYNLKSNPLLEVVEEAIEKINSDTKRRFNEQLRAERESFRAVFDRRRQRIGGLGDADDE